ncbi:MAG TPA: PKD domain-containing protein, partial [Bacteroidia bacterium]
NVNAGPDQIICSGTMSANLNGTVAGGATTGVWSTLGSGTFSPNNTTLNATYNLSAADTTAGTVTLLLTSTNNMNCLAVTDTMVITITSIPLTVAGSDTTACANNAVITLGGTITGGNGTGIWTTTNGTGTFSPNDSTLNATYTPSGSDISNGSVTLILTATNACMSTSDTITITYTPAPVVNAGPDQTICAGASVNLNGTVTIATGGVWSTTGTGTFVPNNTTLNATYIPSAADTVAGTVTLILNSTGNGTCLAVADSMVITIQIKPNADFTHTPACLNNAVSFTDISSGSVNSWSWNFGNGTSTQQNPSNTFASTGMQSVTLIVSTSAGCADTITKNIFVNPLPTAMFGYVTACPDSAAFTDNSTISSGSLTWGWAFGDSTFSNLQNPTHTYDSAGTYVVVLTATSDSGCVASYSDTVNVIDCDEHIVNDPVLPGAFTPNGDGHNDVLYVKGGPFALFDFRIFDEWGKEIYHGTSQTEGWDGTYKSKMQPGGTYVWTINVTTLDNRVIKKAGDVTLVR